MIDDEGGDVPFFGRGFDTLLLYHLEKCRIGLGLFESGEDGLEVNHKCLFMILHVDAELLIFLRKIATAEIPRVVWRNRSRAKVLVELDVLDRRFRKVDQTSR